MIILIIKKLVQKKEKNNKNLNINLQKNFELI